MTVIRKMGTLLCIGDKKMFWVSKKLAVDYVKADKLVACLSEWLEDLQDPRIRSPLPFDTNALLCRISKEFGFTIVVLLHMVTEKRLISIEYPLSDTEANVGADPATGDTDLMEVSRYMMYLLVAHPSLLSLTRSAADAVEEWQEWPDRRLSATEEEFDVTFQPGKDGLEGIKELWIRLLVYAAYKSQPELHMAPLARGGELLSLVWLLLTRKGFRSHPLAFKMELARDPSEDTPPTTYLL
jgi:hypothetical protein